MNQYKSHKDLLYAPLGTRESTANKTGMWRVMRPKLNEEKCTKCYVCWKFCPDSAIEIPVEGEYPVINYEYCKGCGICANECKPKAIEMEPES
jgi:2-oxoacid:acceptor oxidoreductase delta subunit (pyruvate/2-ketoisovalerate family)